ncbi:DUF1617 family protein [Clostridium sp. YIM B02506]|uniref:DUF1617 family protein n=1 Tax=Clostridium sp. YIM B02506 TaxID=2910680 RepID=UPI001EEEA0A2|nr:DUF1617 family protein [Clostridium sp. YIM B02506]
MKVKLSNERIVNDAANLRTISEKQLPVKVSYAIAKNMAKIESELKVYNKERAKLIDKYGEKENDGKLKLDEHGSIVIREDSKDKWDKAIDELLEIENEIDIHKFNMDLLEGHSIKPSELMTIDYMIED